MQVGPPFLLLGEAAGAAFPLGPQAGGFVPGPAPAEQTRGAMCLGAPVILHQGGRLPPGGHCRRGLPLSPDRAACPFLSGSAPPHVSGGRTGSCVRSFREEGWGARGCPPLDISSLLCPQPPAPGGPLDKLGGGWAGPCTPLLACPGSGTLDPPLAVGGQQPHRCWRWGGAAGGAGTHRAQPASPWAGTQCRDLSGPGRVGQPPLG